MKKIAIIFCLLAAIMSNAENPKFAYNGFYFEVISAKERTCKLVSNPDGSGAYSGVVEVPATAVFNGNELKVTTWGQKAIYNTSDVTEIRIPEGYTTIENFGITNLYKVKKITLPESLETIGYNNFRYCGELESINIPSKIKIIDGNSFVDNKLTSIYFPNGLESIGDNSFSESKELETIYWPESLQSVGDNCFSQSSNLKAIYYRAETPHEIMKTGKVTQRFDFTDHIYVGATLYVRPECLDAAAELEPWCNFLSVKTYEPSGINEVNADKSDIAPIEYVSLDGRVSKTPFKGLNMVRMSDNTIKKIVIK